MSNELTKSFPPGSILFRQGDFSSELYILNEGTVEVMKGDEVIAEVSEKGTYLGEMSILLGVPRSATLRARTACEFVVVPQEKVDVFFKHSSDLGLQLARVLASRLLMMNSKYMGLAARVVKSKEGGGSESTSASSASPSASGSSATVAADVAGERAKAPVAPKKRPRPRKGWKADGGATSLSVLATLWRLTQTEEHRIFLHFYARRSAVKSEVSALAERCHVSGDRMREVLSDFQSCGMVHVTPDAMVYLLEPDEDGLAEAISGWGTVQPSWHDGPIDWSEM